MAILNVITAQDLTIKADWQKNFTIQISGIENLDTSYSLTLKKLPHIVEYVTGDQITISGDVISIVFSGSDFIRGTYLGVFESESKNSNLFIRLNITLVIE